MSRVSMGLLSVVFFSLAGCRERVVHDLNEMDAHRVMTTLLERGILAEREVEADGEWSVTVPQGDSSRAIIQLTTARVLRGRPAPPTEQSGLLASRESQRFHFERSLSAELEKTLLTLDGVLDARVHLNLPPTEPLLGHPIRGAQGTASVLLFVAPGMPITADQVAGLVSGGAGVPRDAIAVVMTEEAAMPMNVERPQARQEEAHLEGVQFLGTGNELTLGLVIGAVALALTCLPAFLGRRRKRNIISKLEGALGNGADESRASGGA